MLRQISMGTLAGWTAEFISYPIDIARVRLQVQTGKPKYKGLIGTCTKIANEEGFLSLYSGLVAGL